MRHAVAGRPVALLLLTLLAAPMPAAAIGDAPAGDRDEPTASDLDVEEWAGLSEECRTAYLRGLAAGLEQARRHYGALRNLGPAALAELATDRREDGSMAGVYVFLDGIDRRLSGVRGLEPLALEDRLLELSDAIDAIGSGGDPGLGVSDVVIAVRAPRRRMEREPETVVELMSLPERERWIKIFLDMGLSEAQAREQARKILERREEQPR